MDIGAPIAMIISLAAIVAGIIGLGGEVMDFVSPAGIALTLVPTFCSLFIAFPTKHVLSAFKHIGIILGRQKFDPLHYVNIMSELAEKARSQGLLALENEAGEIEDSFIKSAALMVADAVEPETVEDRLQASMDAMTVRHSQAWALYDRGAAFVPAFGMLATVVSLINMLANLDFSDAGGVASLGINMSAALVTTFYGSLFANIFFMPLGAKLRGRHQKEIDCKKIVLVGILAIQRGINPRVVREMLLERLDPKFAAALSDE